MNKIDFLPIGTVLYVKGGFEKVMIVSRGLMVNIGESNHYFDYGACRYPQGLIKDEIMYFNKEDIANVVARGYEDENSEALNESINHWFNKLNIVKENTMDIKEKDTVKESVE